MGVAVCAANDYVISDSIVSVYFNPSFISYRIISAGHAGIQGGNFVVHSVKKHGVFTHSLINCRMRSIGSINSSANRAVIVITQTVFSGIGLIVKTPYSYGVSSQVALKRLAELQSFSDSGLFPNSSHGNQNHAGQKADYSYDN